MIVARLKGRLDHAFRTKGIPLNFSRKVALRSLGENTQAGVDQYIANQVDKEQFVDDRFGASLKGVHTCLAEPSCRSTRSQFGALLVSIASGTCRCKNIIELLCERTANDGRQVPGGTVAGETDSPVRQAHRGLWGEKDGIKRVFVLAE